MPCLKCRGAGKISVWVLALLAIACIAGALVLFCGSERNDHQKEVGSFAQSGQGSTGGNDSNLLKKVNDAQNGSAKESSSTGTLSRDLDRMERIESERLDRDLIRRLYPGPPGEFEVLTLVNTEIVKAVGKTDDGSLVCVGSDGVYVGDGIDGPFEHVFAYPNPEDLPGNVVHRFDHETLDPMSGVVYAVENLGEAEYSPEYGESGDRSDADEAQVHAPVEAKTSIVGIDISTGTKNLVEDLEDCSVWSLACYGSNLAVVESKKEMLRVRFVDPGNQTAAKPVAEPVILCEESANPTRCVAMDAANNRLYYATFTREEGGTCDAEVIAIDLTTPERKGSLVRGVSGRFVKSIDVSKDGENMLLLLCDARGPEFPFELDELTPLRPSQESRVLESPNLWSPEAVFYDWRGDILLHGPLIPGGDGVSAGFDRTRYPRLRHGPVRVERQSRLWTHP